MTDYERGYAAGVNDARSLWLRGEGFKICWLAKPLPPPPVEPAEHNPASWEGGAAGGSDIGHLSPAPRPAEAACPDPVCGCCALPRSICVCKPGCSEDRCVNGERCPKCGPFTDGGTGREGTNG